MHELQTMLTDERTARLNLERSLARMYTELLTRVGQERDLADLRHHEVRCCEVVSDCYGRCLGWRVCPHGPAGYLTSSCSKAAPFTSILPGAGLLERR
jgi:hypothetical protein